MADAPLPPGNSANPYGPEYQYFRDRLAKQGPLSYEWWASHFTARLVRRHHKDGRLLEIGCGLGRTLQLLESDFETYGTDISAFALQIAHQVASRTHIIQMDARECFAFRGECFDVVLATYVFEHLENPGQTLAQCAHLLKPGGTLVCFVPNTECVSRRWKGEDWFGFRDKGHVSLLSSRAWLDLVVGSGLRIERIFGDGLWDAPYVPYVPTSIQRIAFLLPSLLQFQLGIPLVPLRLGENLGIVARKDGAPGNRRQGSRRHNGP
jgi:SAM-dependent methyltransferase